MRQMQDVYLSEEWIYVHTYFLFKKKALRQKPREALRE